MRCCVGWLPARLHTLPHAVVLHRAPIPQAKVSCPFPLCLQVCVDLASCDACISCQLRLPRLKPRPMSASGLDMPEQPPVSFRRHYDKLGHMEEGTKQGTAETNGTAEPQANGRSYPQEPVASYLTLHSLMNCGLVKCAACARCHAAASNAIAISTSACVIGRRVLTGGLCLPRKCNCCCVNSLIRLPALQVLATRPTGTLGCQGCIEIEVRGHELLGRSDMPFGIWVFAALIQHMPLSCNFNTCIGMHRA